MWPFTKKTEPVEQEQKQLNSPNAWNTILVNESYAGSWQHNDELSVSDGLSQPIVFACVNRISQDISKMPIDLYSKDSEGVLKKKSTDILDKPNNYQTTPMFLAQWELSIQSYGNAYIYKDIQGNQLKALHVLNPRRVKPLISPSGMVFYEIKKDELSQTVDETVPADRIIHDRINCLYHPLVGISPLYAVALSVLKSRAIEKTGYRQFVNGGAPIGVLSFPGAVDEDTAIETRDRWEQSYGPGGDHTTAVLGEGATYNPVSPNAEDSQVIEQLQFSSEQICSVFGVPKYKVGVGTDPTYNNVEKLNLTYFSDVIQARVIAIQTILNQGLEVKSNERYRFDIDALLLMDSETRMKNLKEGVGSAIYSPNEARREVGLKPVDGGDSPMIQQQNYSLEALAKRDAKEDPFESYRRTTQPTQSDDGDGEKDMTETFNIIKSIAV